MNSPDPAPRRTGPTAWIARGGQAWRDRPWLPDAVLVGGLALWLLITTAALGLGEFVIGVVQIAPLFWRRRYPLPVAGVVATGCLMQVALMESPHPANIAVPIAIYSAAAFGTRFESRAVLALGLLGAVVAGVSWTAMWGSLGRVLFAIGFQTIFLAMFVGVTWVLGDVVRRRKAVVSRLEAQNRALARDQAQRSRLAAQDERAAIAREMHDVVAHSLAVVVVQADGALYAARTALEQPPAIGADRAALERAAQTLDTLAQTARASLSETRRLVGVLREEGAGAEYSPLQGLAHVDDLVQRVRDSGLAVRLAVRGEVTNLSREVDLAAYRVVQESLTNALKHAGPDATVDVDVLRTPAVLLVRVTDDGQGLNPDSDGEGNGILGMAERVEVLGGTVHAGSRSPGGWEVVASIPARTTEDEAGSGDRLGGRGSAPEQGHGIPSTGPMTAPGGIR
ncbi:sensor histidine kinase [Ornithinimicrobium sp. Y1694]|uniref:sensor histidine kinase n=1 Tax=Ornithinimicrobium sp. Y1694 TaxID=3418590 RepID=UPI003CFA2B8F